MNRPGPVMVNADQLADMDPGEAFTAVLRFAAAVRASDLFLLTDENAVRIAVRRLGAVETVAFVPREFGRHLITHVKALADMDISEHRRPQDGRRVHQFDDRRVDMRINCLGALFGEDMTIRIWDHSAGIRTLDQLGLSRGDLTKLTAMLNSPSGLLLVTGPTGTGKTTTLYACMEHLNDGAVKINTLEDPVEYALQGVRQTQVQPNLGLDFADLLPSVLRQAPDVIMIGEIRDPETAATAVRAANSGHLVLATLHAPVAASAVQSMFALGAHPFFLASCLVGVVAQRLIRTLCPQCRVCYDISESPETFREIQRLLGPDEGKAIYGPSGCDECFHVGYAGRTGLFEIMTITQEIRRLISQSRPSEEIEQAAIRGGMIELRRGALLKVAQGVTSTEEILRDVPPEYLGIED